MNTTCTKRSYKVFRCEWKRCAFRDSTREELLRHIDQTHLSHISLPCPIKSKLTSSLAFWVLIQSLAGSDCRETFSRQQLFFVHFTEHHNGLENTTITSTILKPSASLSPPRYNALTLPLTHATGIPTYTIQAPLVKPAKAKLPYGPSLSFSQSQASKRHKHVRLQLSQAVQNNVDPDDDSEEVVDFPIDDICQETLEHEEIVIHPTTKMKMDKSLSCPVWIQGVSSLETPDTIGIKIIESQFSGT